MVYNLYSDGWEQIDDRNSPLITIRTGSWTTSYAPNLITGASNYNSKVGIDVLAPINDIALSLRNVGPSANHFVGIRNQSSLNLFPSDPFLIHLPVTFWGFSKAKGSGVEGAGILNTLNALIQTGSAGDTILGRSYSISEASGISNHGTIKTGDGADTVAGQIFSFNNNINIRFAIENDGLIQTGNTSGEGANDKDTVQGDASNSPGGISNSGWILTGVGDDLITGTVTSSSSGSIAILNNGFIETGEGSDTITATATGTGSIGLSNNRSINTGGLLASDVDVITGISNSGGIYSYGIKNNGSIYTSNGNDSITGQSNEGYGLYNNGLISTSDGNDTITSIGNAKAMVNDNSIYTGKGNDIITGQSLNRGFGIYNNGLIDTGDGDDLVTSIGDFGYSNMSSGKNKDHSVLLGNGADKSVGFGRGYFDGGADFDILELPILDFFGYKIDYCLTKGTGSSATIERDSDGITMNTNNFEKLVAGSFNQALTLLNAGDVICF
jgi:hypothetical protein